jgi:hypothetical protein
MSHTAKKCLECQKNIWKNESISKTKEYKKEQSRKHRKSKTYIQKHKILCPVCKKNLMCIGSEQCQKCVSNNKLTPHDKKLYRKKYYEQKHGRKEKKSKVCTECHIRRPLDSFSPKKGGKYGKASKCKKCMKKIGKNLYRTNSIIERERFRKRYWNNPEKYREISRKSSKKNSKKRKCCSNCKESKLLRFFNKNNINLDGRASVCKKCESLVKRTPQYRESHRINAKERTKNLTNDYIRILLRSEGIEDEKISSELIELKRLETQSFRLLVKSNKLEKTASNAA